MNIISNFISALISYLFIKLFDMTTPCEITNEFFYLCGHTVTSRRCRNNARRSNRPYLREDACNATCRTRTLPTITHMHMTCLWCGTFPHVPATTSIRSDPGVDIIEPSELLRRRDAHRNEYRCRMPDQARALFNRMASRRAQWEALKRSSHAAQDLKGVHWRDRIYYVGGGGIDHRLMRPLTADEISPAAADNDDDDDDDHSADGNNNNDNDNRCGICAETLRAGTTPPAVVLPCHETHRMHSECVERWLVENELTNRCPYCREAFRIVVFEEWCAGFEGEGGFFSD